MRYELTDMDTSQSASIFLLSHFSFLNFNVVAT